MRATPKLRVERMEDRLTPAGFGNAWVDTNLTVSFAPDGTDVGGTSSSLYRTLGGRATPDEWQGAIAAAFQTWIAPTNLNFAIVPDDGRPVGTPGPVQGSPFVGDIRITARPLSDNVLAIANPFDLISPWAGEIVLNSNKVFDTDGSADANCLYTVMLHEIGHALGLPGSADSGSVMNEYGGRVSALSPQDVAAVQALYGTRQEDRFDANNGNDTLIQATGLSYVQSVSQLNGIDGTAGSKPYVADGDITRPSDVDQYWLSNTTEVDRPTAVVQTNRLSTARLKVSVFWQRPRDPAGVATLIASTSTPDANGNYVVPVVSRGAGWFIVRVEAASATGPFAVGSYRLSMGNGLTAIPDSQYATKILSASGTVTESDDWAGGVPANDTLATATKLGSARDATTARWDFSGTATLGAPADVDVYQVRTTAKSGGVLLVSVATPTGGVAPRATVFDGKGNRLQTEVMLANAGGTIIQIQGIRPNSTYYVSVSSGRPSSWIAATSYQLGIDFRDTAVSLAPFTTGTLTDAQPGLFRTLDVNRTQLFRFQLAASGTTESSAAELTIYDEAGKAVFTLSAANGQTVIGDVLLAPGRYTVAITGDPGVFVDGRFMALTDPIGLTAPSDPTTDPGANRVAPPSEPFTWTSYEPSYYAWLM
jgi:Matrixin